MSPRGLGVMESCRGGWQPGCVRCRRGCTTSSFGLLSEKMLVNALSVTQRAGERSVPLPHLGWVGCKSSASRDPRLALPSFSLPLPRSLGDPATAAGSRAQGFGALVGEPGRKVAAEVGWVDDWLAQNGAYLFKKWKWGLISIYWLQLAYKSHSGTWRKEKDQAAT